MSRPIFLGGSLHKTDKHIVTRDTNCIRVPVSPTFEELYASYDNHPLVMKVETYTKEYINMFGLTLEVWVESSCINRMWALCVDALLSDYAKDGVWS